jgi:hypothetical protein
VISDESGPRFGRVSGASVRETILDLGRVVPRAQLALVRFVDSEAEVSSIPAVHSLLARGRGVRSGRSVLLSANELVALAREGLFTGFDEIWVFLGNPAEPTPPLASILPPIDLCDEPLAHELADWMATNQVALGIGDGEGMNYVTLSRDTESGLKRHVKDSPQTD